MFYFKNFCFSKFRFFFFFFFFFKFFFYKILRKIDFLGLILIDKIGLIKKIESIQLIDTSTKTFPKLGKGILVFNKL